MYSSNFVGKKKRKKKLMDLLFYQVKLSNLIILSKKQV